MKGGKMRVGTKLSLYHSNKLKLYKFLQQVGVLSHGIGPYYHDIINIFKYA